MASDKDSVFATSSSVTSMSLVSDTNSGISFADAPDDGAELKTLREETLRLREENAVLRQNVQDLDTNAKGSREKLDKQYWINKDWRTATEKLLQECIFKGEWDQFISVAKTYSDPKFLPAGTAMFAAISGTAPKHVLHCLDYYPGLSDLTLEDNAGLTPLMLLANVKGLRNYQDQIPIYQWMVDKHPDNEFFNKTWDKRDSPTPGPSAFDMACQAENWALIYQMCVTPLVSASYTFLTDVTQFQATFDKLQEQFEKTQSEANRQYSYATERAQMIVINDNTLIPLSDWKAHKAKMLKDATAVLKWYAQHIGLSPQTSDLNSETENSATTQDSATPFLRFSSSSSSLSSSPSLAPTSAALNLEVDPKDVSKKAKN